MGLAAYLFFTPSGCGFLAYLNFDQLVKRVYVPFKGKCSCITYVGKLECGWPIDTILSLLIQLWYASDTGTQTRAASAMGTWTPPWSGWTACCPAPGARLRDLPTFIRTMNADDTKLSINIKQCELDAPAADGILLNTFDALERRAVEAVGACLPNTFTVGPLGAPDLPYLPGLISSLWRDDDRCAAWLDGHAEEGDASVVYVNFGSITMDEFAWGLAAAGCPFLWVVRPDMVRCGGSVLPDGFEAAVAGRGLMVGWCDQEAVLAHRATVGLLSHCGWNSTLESVRAGVPMLCWPFFAEQVINCRYVCDEWGVGMEMPCDCMRRGGPRWRRRSGS
ncbi:hypothetical protein EJB05_28670, partial [Eragrostis curvula]